LTNGVTNSVFAYFIRVSLLYYVPVKFNVILAQAIKPGSLKMGKIVCPGMVDGIINTRCVITMKTRFSSHMNELIYSSLDS
jgi:hypothetical protein